MQDGVITGIPGREGEVTGQSGGWGAAGELNGRRLSPHVLDQLVESCELAFSRKQNNSDSIDNIHISQKFRRCDHVVGLSIAQGV